MPKRVLDFDAMWGSDKLSACAEWAQAEYAWLYGLADASGCFELTNVRVIWGRVAAIRRNLTLERLERIFSEFQDKGLLFVWEHEGKRYGHWTGSDVPGRLPPPSWRARLEKFAPPVPKRLLQEYMERFSRGRAALACADRNSRELKAGLEGTQAQDLDLNGGMNQERETVGKWNANGQRDRGNSGEREYRRQRETENTSSQLSSSPTTSSSTTTTSNSANSTPHSKANLNPPLEATQDSRARSDSSFASAPSRDFRERRVSTGRCGSFTRADYAALQLQRDLRVGEGPVCEGPLKPEVLERIRKREEARRAVAKSP